LARFSYQVSAWSKPRWMVGIRQPIERRTAPRDKPLNLFADDPGSGRCRACLLRIEESVGWGGFITHDLHREEWSEIMRVELANYGFQDKTAATCRFTLPSFFLPLPGYQQSLTPPTTHAPANPLAAV